MSSKAKSYLLARSSQPQTGTPETRLSGSQATDSDFESLWQPATAGAAAGPRAGVSIGALPRRHSDLGSGCGAVTVTALRWHRDRQPAACPAAGVTEALRHR